MFIIVVAGGRDDGERLDVDGWASYGASKLLKFEDLADAQDWIERHAGRVARGEYGLDATLVIDEI